MWRSRLTRGIPSLPLHTDARDAYRHVPLSVGLHPAFYYADHSPSILARRRSISMSHSLSQWPCGPHCPSLAYLSVCIDRHR